MMALKNVCRIYGEKRIKDVNDPDRKFSGINRKKKTRLLIFHYYRHAKTVYESTPRERIIKLEYGEKQRLQ